jgi:hypothetical protein
MLNSNYKRGVRVCVFYMALEDYPKAYTPAHPTDIYFEVTKE